MTAASGTPNTRVMVIGAGWRFTSGISHYTYRLSIALAEQYQVSALLVRRLVPKRLYPGADRVGADLNDAVYPASIPVYDGVDWYWGRSMARALKFIDQQRPDVVILQWWTGAVLHSYVRLARYAARRGAWVILEWHEGQDVGEALLPEPASMSARSCPICYRVFPATSCTPTLICGPSPLLTRLPAHQSA